MTPDELEYLEHLAHQPRWGQFCLVVLASVALASVALFVILKLLL